MSEPKINYLGLAIGASAAIATLHNLGYVYSGGQQWKPPMGTKPDFDLVDTLRAERDALQLRLNAADQRIDELESKLIESRKITLSGCEFSEHELIGRAVRAATGTYRRGTQRWVAMKDAFGCGSGVAHALCFRFGFDPDEMVKP